MEYADDKTMVNIGRFSGAVGLKGEVRVTLYAKDSDNLHVGSKLYVAHKGRSMSTGNAPDDGSVKGKSRGDGNASTNGNSLFEVIDLRMQKGKPVVRLSGVEDRNSAEDLNGAEIYIHEDDLAELPEGEYYFRELIGLEVYDRASARVIGEISDVLEYPAQNLYVVRLLDDADDADAESKDGGDGARAEEIMIPAVPAFVKEIDTKRGVVEVELIEGLL